MLAIPGYDIKEVIHLGSRSIIYRGIRENDGQPVVLKSIRDQQPTPDDLLRFRREFETIRRLDDPGIPRALALESLPHGPVLIMEDIGGRDLKAILAETSLTIRQLVNISVKMAAVLDRLHAAKLIHADIKTSNFILNLSDDILQLIDFGSSLPLTADVIAGNMRQPAGTPAYMSPEQSGRMNRPIDWRTDLYSLGVTLYEVFTRGLPFNINDGLGLIHAHIARMPEAPHHLDPETPPVISDIIMKLLAKNPEDRYQSARGLANDLNECLDRQEQTGRISSFSIARQDKLGRFEISRRCVGREKELKRLDEGYAHVAGGCKTIQWVEGTAGSGKTALVLEAGRAFTSKGAIFLRGQFAITGTKLPFEAVVQALRDLVLHLLGEDDAGLARWRDKLRAALGGRGKVALDLIPEMESIIGEQPELVKLEPAAEQRRIRQVLVELVGVLCKPNRPLVLFLDAMDLADAASLELLESLLTEKNVEFLYIIGAYRSEGIHENHELTVFQNAMEKKEISSSHLTVSALSAEHLTDIVADTLKCDPERGRTLGRIVMEKTGGNPYFAVEFLSMLYTDGLIRFNVENRRWEWDIEDIATRMITDNVAELLSKKLERLDEKQAFVLMTAAALGRQCDLTALAAATDMQREETAAILRELGEAGILLPLGRACIDSFMNSGMNGFTDDADSLSMKCEFRFAHEQLLQAAYGLIPEADRTAFHHRIGVRLMQRYDADDQGKTDEALYQLADQFNAGGEVPSDENESIDHAGIYMEAGLRAKAASLFEKAFAYFNAGQGLLGVSHWRTHYPLSLQLYTELTEAAYLCGHFDLMNRMADMVCEHAQSALDRADVYEVQIQYLIDRNRWEDAVKRTLTILKQLGLRLSLFPNKVGAFLCLMATKGLLVGKSAEMIMALPSMSDPTRKAIMRILMRAATPIVALYPDLYTTVISRMMRITIRHGLEKASASTFMGYGLLLGTLGKVKKGYGYGRIGLRLIEGKGRRFSTIAPKFAFHFGMGHWKNHLQETLSPLMEIHRTAREEGDAFYAAYSAAYHCVHALLSSRSLDDIEETMERIDRVVASTSIDAGYHFMRLYRQVVANFISENENPVQLNGAFYDESTMMQIDSEADNKGRDLGLYSSKLFLGLVFGELESAEEHVDQVNKLFQSGPMMTAIVPSTLYWSAFALILASRNASPDKRWRLKQKSKSEIKRLRRWAQWSPVNYTHKLALVEAVDAWITGRVHNAVVLEKFDVAISLSEENDYICDRAMACEWAARFCMEQGRSMLASTYLKEARNAYFTWGARAKVKQLEDQYTDLLTTTDRSKLTETMWNTPPGTTSSGEASEALDLASVLKSTQAMTGEIILDKLLTKMLHIMMENAGAGHGFLVMTSPDGLMVEAEASLETMEPSPRPSLPLEECTTLSRSIVHTVARTLTPVVLDDAATEGRFARTTYIRKQRPKSILCMPLTAKDKLVGVLYLENNLATAVFTRNHLEVLGLLSAQAAAALDNARLYDRLADYSRSLERIIASLDLAQEVQQSLLPKSIPRNTHVDLDGRSIYCDETGGDYYDFIPLKQDRLAVVVGDVSGHGISSALLMASARGFLRSRAALGGSPSEIMTDVNRLVSTDTEETGQFMTAFYLEVSQEPWEVAWVRAGHDPAILYCPQSDTFVKLTGPGIALGMDAAYRFQDHRRPVEPGQILLVTTDGIFEARNSKGEMFGRERFQSIVKANAGLEAEGIRKAVMDAVVAFRGEAPQDDDITLVVLKFKNIVRAPR